MVRVDRVTTADAPIAPTPAVGAPARVRVPFWDNARFATIALVVIGHAIQRQTSDSNNALILYLFIYAFHIPAFALISGYFSKASPPSTRQMLKIITDIVIPYVIDGSLGAVITDFDCGNLVMIEWTCWESSPSFVELP